MLPVELQTGSFSPIFLLGKCYDCDHVLTTERCNHSRTCKAGEVNKKKYSLEMYFLKRTIILFFSFFFKSNDPQHVPDTFILV